MWIKASLDSIIKETKSTWRFIVNISPNKIFLFKPGQFIQIKVNDVMRSYSIASIPNDQNKIELVIVKINGGIMSNYLFNKIKQGEKFEIKGPLGKFVLPDKIDRDIFFICTGTGIAPFRSMLRFIEKYDIKYQKIFLIFGTRMISDLLFYNEMLEYSNKLDNVNYIPILSREKWNNDNGYVHEIYKKILNQKKYEKEPLFYLCGWRDMIKEAKANLRSLGVDSKSIKIEIYG